MKKLTWKHVFVLWMILALLFGLVPLAILALAADVEIDNAAPTNITRVSAYVNATVVNTNATNPTLTLYYGTSDAGTNAGSWQFTNSYGVASTGAVSTNITGLTPAQLYYYRWYALDTVSNQYDWAGSTTSFWTTAGAPTSSAPDHSYYPLVVDTNGVLAAPTNFWTTNSLMLTTTYDTDGDSVVDNAETLGGNDTNYYRNAANQTGTLSSASVPAAQLTGNIAAGRLTNALPWDGTNDWTGTLAGQEGSYYRDAANQTGTLSSASVPASQLTGGGVTYNHSWIDNDGVTNQVNYYNGVATNIYTNGVSIIP